MATNCKIGFHKSKSVWPIASCEVPFFPEFPVRKGVNESNFKVLSTISSGAYGKVYQVTANASNGSDEPDSNKCSSLYAMKVMSKSKIFAGDSISQVKEEVRINTLVGYHPFLVQHRFTWQNRKNLFLVTDFVNGGDLHTLWQQSGCFDEALLKIFLAELALVLDFLHNAGIIYRDLKMENILLDDKGHIKLIDFGLSKWLSIGSKTKTMCGTSHYMAPEILNNEWYIHAIDWWALGVLCYALLQGQFPFRDPPIGVQEAPELEFGSRESDNTALCRLVRSLLTREPTKRLRSLRTLQNHAFYHHFDFEALRTKQIDPLPLLEKQRLRRRFLDDEKIIEELIDF